LNWILFKNPGKIPVDSLGKPTVPRIAVLTAQGHWSQGIGWGEEGRRGAAGDSAVKGWCLLSYIARHYEGVSNLSPSSSTLACLCVLFPQPILFQKFSLLTKVVVLQDVCPKSCKYGWGRLWTWVKKKRTHFWLYKRECGDENALESDPPHLKMRPNVRFDFVRGIIFFNFFFFFFGCIALSWRLWPWATMVG